MGLMSGIVGSLVGAGASALAGGANSAISYQMSKGLAKYNYELGQRSLVNSPSAYKTGLKKAGLNPMLAAGANNVGSTQGGAVINPNMDFSDSISKLSNSAVARKQMESNLKLQDAQVDKANAEAEATRKQAEASMIQAKAQAQNSTVNATTALSQRALMDAQTANYSSLTGLSDQKLNYLMSHPEEYEAYLKAKMRDPEFQQKMQKINAVVNGVGTLTSSALDVTRTGQAIKFIKQASKQNK